MRITFKPEDAKRENIIEQIKSIPSYPIVYVYEGEDEVVLTITTNSPFITTKEIHKVLCQYKHWFKYDTSVSDQLVKKNPYPVYEFFPGEEPSFENAIKFNMKTAKQKHTGRVNRTPMDIYYQDLKSSIGQIERKVYAIESPYSISFLVNMKNKESKKTYPVQIEIQKSLFYINYGTKQGYASRNCPTYEVKQCSKRKYRDTNILNYITVKPSPTDGKLKVREEFYIEMLVDNSCIITEKYKDTHTFEKPLIVAGDIYPVEKIKDLKDILGDYYEEFMSLFEVVEENNTITLTITDKYREHRRQIFAEEKANCIPTEAEQAKIEKQKAIQMLNQASENPNSAFKIPNEAKLTCTFCEEQNNQLYWTDPTSSFYLSMVAAFVKKLPYSIDKEQNDDYVPGLFFNKLPIVKNDFSFFRFPQNQNIYAAMTNCLGAIPIAGIIIQICTIFQRMILGELPPDYDSIKREFQELDNTNIYSKYQEKINNLLWTVVCYYNILCISDAEERRSILEQFYNEVDAKTYYILKDSMESFLSSKMVRSVPITSERNPEICESILAYQQKNNAPKRPTK